MRPENPNGNCEMSDPCETPDAPIETGATIPNSTPDERAEFARYFNRLNATQQIIASAVAEYGVALVEMRLIDTVFGCETLSAWAGWRLPPVHQALRLAEIAAHGLFEHGEMVAIIVTGKPMPGVIEGDNAVEVFGLGSCRDGRWSTGAARIAKRCVRGKRAIHGRSPAERVARRSGRDGHLPVRRWVRLGMRAQ